MATANPVVSYKLEVWASPTENAPLHRVGFMQSLKASQKRDVKLIRQLVGVDVGETLEGVAQIPQAPTYALTLTRVALYHAGNTGSTLLNAPDIVTAVSGSTSLVTALLYQQLPFQVVKYRVNPSTSNYESVTIWHDCMITSYDMGSYDVGGAEVIESCEVQALRCRTFRGATMQDLQTLIAGVEVT